MIAAKSGFEGVPSRRPRDSSRRASWQTSTDSTCAGRYALAPRASRGLMPIGLGTKRGRAVTLEEGASPKAARCPPAASRSSSARDPPDTGRAYIKRIAPCGALS